MLEQLVGPFLGNVVPTVRDHFQPHVIGVVAVAVRHEGRDRITFAEQME